MPRMFMFPAEPHLGDATEQPLAAAQTFKRGALVLFDANEDIAETGADPALILGVAAHDAAVTDFETIMHVFKASEGQKFWGSGDNDPTKADINQQYGVTKDADGVWHIDGTKTGATARTYIHDVDLDRKLYKFSVLAANRQAAP